jgi:hypothetical protein
MGPIGGARPSSCASTTASRKNFAVQVRHACERMLGEIVRRPAHDPDLTVFPNDPNETSA